MSFTSHLGFDVGVAMGNDFASSLAIVLLDDIITQYPIMTPMLVTCIL